MKKKKIYLCHPYSHPIKAICVARYESATEIAARLMKQDYIVFSPITHSHPVSLHLGNSLSHDFWLEQDFAYIEWADEVWVALVDGWDSSTGIRREVDKARELGKPIVYFRPAEYGIVIIPTMRTPWGVIVDAAEKTMRSPNEPTFEGDN